jgi:hypothetical protein
VKNWVIATCCMLFSTCAWASVKVVRFADSPDELLSSFIHEQLHWYLHEHDSQQKAAIAELRQMYPNAPVGLPEGAENAYSTYGHLVDCYLEIQADRELIGSKRTDDVIKNKPWYTGIYKTILRDEDKIRAVVQEHGLELSAHVGHGIFPEFYQQADCSVRPVLWQHLQGTFVLGNGKVIHDFYIRIDPCGPQKLQGATALFCPKTEKTQASVVSLEEGISSLRSIPAAFDSNTIKPHCATKILYWNSRGSRTDN